MRARGQIPLILILMVIGCGAMVIPALHAAVQGDDRLARTFLFSAGFLGAIVAMACIAASTYAPRNVARSQLAALAGAYGALPVLFAIPFHQAVPDTTFFNAWWEMLSSFTTTGATLYDGPGRLADTLHLWRAMVGWMGGLLILVGAAALLAPLDLGGVEVISGRVPGRGAQGVGQVIRVADPRERLVRLTLTVFPVYVAYTLALWVLLVLSGSERLAALCIAMSVLSSSSVVAGEGLHAAGGGFAAEFAVFAFLLLGLTRRSFPGTALVDRQVRVWDDPELRTAVFFLVVVPGLLFLRHWVGAAVSDDVQDIGAALSALWGAVFTTLSFLSTTGFESSAWEASRSWSGLSTPGLVLVGLAMMGGGIATTTGGLKLLRVYALMRQGEAELNRIVHPHGIVGGGAGERRLRSEGAHAAWIFFMLYALSLALAIALLSLVGVSFYDGLILAVAALSTTGPLAVHAGDVPIIYAELTAGVKVVLAGLMVLGRLEVLAILALLAPSVWRQ
jgi:trk system potassium uptake protein TrkH